ncbi:MAG: hypothetical protein IT450_02240 [Phycisphaerales bacterium]|nr:hypothetical protein [Phycisphaerales bacterium]
MTPWPLPKLIRECPSAPRAYLGLLYIARGRLVFRASRMALERVAGTHKDTTTKCMQALNAAGWLTYVVSKSEPGQRWRQWYDVTLPEFSPVVAGYVPEETVRETAPAGPKKRRNPVPRRGLSSDDRHDAKAILHGDSALRTAPNGLPPYGGGAAADPPLLASGSGPLPETTAQRIDRIERERIEQARARRLAAGDGAA